MSSDEYEEPEASTSSLKNSKRHVTNELLVKSSQLCIASAMAKVVNRMVNTELQQHCKELLEMDDLAETEARILFVLQQIDLEREEEAKKESSEARKAKSRKRK